MILMTGIPHCQANGWVSINKVIPEHPRDPQCQTRCGGGAPVYHSDTTCHPPSPTLTYSPVVQGHWHLPAIQNTEAVVILDAGDLTLLLGQEGGGWVLLGGHSVPEHIELRHDCSE